MSQINFTIRAAPQSQWLLRWQARVIAAFAAGSLFTALFTIGALMAVSVARSALSHFAAARRWADHHG